MPPSSQHNRIRLAKNCRFLRDIQQNESVFLENNRRFYNLVMISYSVSELLYPAPFKCKPVQGAFRSSVFAISANSANAPYL